MPGAGGAVKSPVERRYLNFPQKRQKIAESLAVLFSLRGVSKAD
jgi:hypothetical protein